MLASVKADDVPVEALERSLARAIGETILFDTLPKLTMSVDIDNLPVSSVLEIITRRLPDYEIETADSYYSRNYTQTQA
jgi:hypothetical protein